MNTPNMLHIYINIYEHYLLYDFFIRHHDASVIDEAIKM